MTESLPANVTALQELVRSQQLEIERLKKRTGALSNTQVLNDMEQSETALTESLKGQLDKIRQEKSRLETELDDRAKMFEASLHKLQARASSVNLAVDSASSIAPSEQVIESNDIELLRRQLTKASETIKSQQAVIKKLNFELEMEQGHVNILRHDNQMLRQMTVDMTALAEQEEEYISNKLLKRISGLKKEKGELLIQVEQEEEYLTNTLQKKLSQLQKEKIDMENALEQEQEYIVNKLQKQLDTLKLQGPGVRSPSLASDHSVDASGIPTSPSLTAKWKPTHSPTISADYGLHNAGLTDVLRAEIASLRSKMVEMEREYSIKFNQYARAKSELIELRSHAGMSADDLSIEDVYPPVFKSVPGSPNRTARRSTSISSQRSMTSEGGSHKPVPPLHLDGSSSSNSGAVPSSPNVGTFQHDEASINSRSRSGSSSSSNTFRKEVPSRRISGGPFGLNALPPQHPPRP
ncbi:hypothetical protein K450DRAFT_226410 [Umbelopsis ramanniana AG]|uniref:Uncharacterized protein n=1 Tax=Umbelopsis ramanniana AG TaxID=1314678 RepID=A0AAD5EFY0_UMBRA|nr:uncharacterized protein K450DRAFT_226410 [Umbelopsis ramanniana AG]KAI8582682.1 hypothetical protein K450DRAFT_226410 [Umbelopsis ramanniana AG]